MKKEVTAISAGIPERGKIDAASHSLTPRPPIVNGTKFDKVIIGKRKIKSNCGFEI